MESLVYICRFVLYLGCIRFFCGVLKGFVPAVRVLNCLLGILGGLFNHVLGFIKDGLIYLYYGFLRFLVRTLLILKLLERLCTMVVILNGNTPNIGCMGYVEITCNFYCISIVYDNYIPG